jgi:hypothetical protein
MRAARRRGITRDMRNSITPDAHHPTAWWTRLDDGRIRCGVRPRACALHERQAGLCFVRQRDGDRIVLTTYSRRSPRAMRGALPA